MQSPLQILRAPLLVLLAIVLGIGVLAVDGARRERAVAAPAPAAAGAPAAAAAPGALVASSEPVAAAAAPPATTTPAPIVVPVVATRGGVACAAPHQLVEVPRDIAVRARPDGTRIGAVPRSSRYLGSPMTAWVQAISPDGRWGKVTVPWRRPVGRAGWIPLAGLRRSSTRSLVVSDLSERRLHVYRGCREVLDVPSAIGAAGSPSPRGRFFVTDRVAVPSDQPQFGSYAFGLSTIQPNTPAGWTGGNQMAIHGTNAPGSIGSAASAGCLRVGERSLARLKPLLGAGTPVIIQA